MRKLTAIMPIVALLLGAAAQSVQANPSAQSTASKACQALPKSEPWKNYHNHTWNVVWRNQIANCKFQALLDAQSAMVQSPSPQASQPQPNLPQASQPTVPAPSIAQENSQPTP